MRVLFISDVYFPRVNGVSTSIRTFRRDPAAHGVETHLVAPRYQAGAPAAEEPGVLRVASAGVPRDPEERGRAYARTWSSAAMAGRLTGLYETLRSAPGPAGVAA